MSNTNTQTPSVWSHTIAATSHRTATNILTAVAPDTASRLAALRARRATSRHTVSELVNLVDIAVATGDIGVLIHLTNDKRGSVIRAARNGITQLADTTHPDELHRIIGDLDSKHLGALIDTLQPANIEQVADSITERLTNDHDPTINEIAHHAVTKWATWWSNENVDSRHHAWRNLLRSALRRSLDTRFTEHPPASAHITIPASVDNRWLRSFLVLAPLLDTINVHEMRLWTTLAENPTSNVTLTFASPTFVFRNETVEHDAVNHLRAWADSMPADNLPAVVIASLCTTGAADIDDICTAVQPSTLCTVAELVAAQLHTNPDNYNNELGAELLHRALDQYTLIRIPFSPTLLRSKHIDPALRARLIVFSSATTLVDALSDEPAGTIFDELVDGLTQRDDRVDIAVEVDTSNQPDSTCKLERLASLPGIVASLTAPANTIAPDTTGGTTLISHIGDRLVTAFGDNAAAWNLAATLGPTFPDGLDDYINSVRRLAGP